MNSAPLDPFLRGMDRCRRGGRQCKIEGRSLSDFRIHPNTAAEAFNDFLAYRQSDAGAGISLPRMQTLKDREDAGLILEVDADAVVTHEKYPFPALEPRADFYSGRLIAAEL